MPDDKVKSVTIPYRDLVIRADPDYERDRVNEREYVMSSGRIFSGNPKKRGAYKAGDAVYNFQLLDFATASDLVNEATFGIANGVRNEINATTDAFAAVLQAFGARNETVVSNDFPTSTTTSLGATETVSISDLLTSTATMALTRAESAATTDAFTVRKVFTESRTETAVTGETPVDNTSTFFDPRTIDATNTGAVLGGTFTTNSSSSITAPGTYTNIRFTNSVSIQPSLANLNAAFLFSNCIFEGTNNNNYACIVPDGGSTPAIPTNIQFEYCTFDCKGLDIVNGLAGAFKRAYRCWFIGFNNCFNLYDPCTIDKCGNDGLMIGGASAHFDCIENNGVPNFTVTNSKFINNQGQTSAIMTNNEFGQLDHITIDNCYLEGGGYTVYCDNTKSSTFPVDPSTFTITNNIIKSGFYGYGDFFTSGVTFGAGNTFIPYGAVTGGADATVTHGSQLIPQGSTGAMVGPTALLSTGATGYPGNLQVMALPSRGYWRIDTPSEWAPTTTFVNNRLITNKGGIVPAGGMVIDGYTIPAGTVVVQYRDFSAGDFYCSGGGNYLFRGCRIRHQNRAPGDFNSTTFTGKLFIFFGDFGGINSNNSSYNEVPLKISGGSCIIYRCYISFTSAGIQINANNSEATENFICKLVYWYGINGPPGETTDKHLNGICTNGGETNIMLLRNNIDIWKQDQNTEPDTGGGSGPHQINQTDCIAFFQDFGSFPGTGTNRDGSVGYKVDSNYVGGTGLCIYAGLNAGKPSTSVSNMKITNTLVTTNQWPNGGAQGGPITAVPPWGVQGNVTTNNKWADGPLAGQTAF